MTRHTQTILYHTLPIAFWLLVAVVCVATYLLSPSLERVKSSAQSDAQWSSVEQIGVGFFAPAVLSLLSVLIVSRIHRHASSAEECFLVALLLGIASYWLPTVLFLILPVWAYLIYRNLYSLRSFTATLLGLATVAVWAAVLVVFGVIGNPWADFFATKNLWAWIPTGAVLIAFIASTIVRQTLRER